MERYQIKFIEEAKELLSSLESSLLELEHNPGNSSIINEIFRIMHSLKGSGAMFGFTRISSFTHDLETIYSAIRSGSLMVSKHLIDISFQSLDLIKELLKGSETSKQLDQLNILTNQLQLILSHKKDENSAPAPVSLAEQEDNPIKNHQELPLWLIRFIPHEDILIEGNDPLYMFDELNTHGELLIVPGYKKLPELSLVNPAKLFLEWNMLLWADVEKDVIESVFLFVKDLSALEITPLKASYPPENKNVRKQLLSLLSREVINQDGIEEVLESNTEDGSEQLKHTSTIPSVQEKIKLDSESPDTEDIQSEEISIRVSSKKIDELMNLVSELITSQGQLMTLTEIHKNSPLYQLSEKFESLIRQLREQAMEMSLISINTLTVRFKRMVRDLSSKLNKQVNLIIEGGDTELDKTIIEHLSEPLLHIIRNAIDHGIESPEERENLGKPGTGEIILKAFYSGAEVHLEISDNGRGIDKSLVHAKALERMLIEPLAQLSEKEIFQLLFKPGFSTMESVSEYSGRGVGMDVVARKIAELRGDVVISSQKGIGTKVLIRLPLTLTILDGLLIHVGETKYIIPISSVRKIFELKLTDLENSFNNLISLEGIQYPFLVLSNEFNEHLPRQQKQQLILVEYDGKQMGLVVDNILGERQVVLKPLGPSLRKNRIFSGGSIMGDGEIALVLDTNKLITKFTSNE
ncbi:MAG: chemotaxis protein CheA [Bacteroidales bacterium]|nr:chemotaxis protein CheA [Bacteroidales bacterium]